MRNLPAKTDGVSTLSAAEFNANLGVNELQNLVTKTGQALDNAGGPDADLNMLGKAAAIYASDGGFYQDSGIADAYVLSRVDTLESPDKYFNGMAVTFRVGNTNTGASTINVASRGVKSIVDVAGNALAGGELVAGQYATLRYNGAKLELVTPKISFSREVKGATGSWTVPPGVFKASLKLAGAGGGAAGGDSFQGGTTSTAGSKGGNSVLTGPGGLSMTSIGGDGGTESSGAAPVDHGGGSGDGDTLVGKGSPGGVEAGMSADPNVSTTGNFATGGANGGLQIHEVAVSPGDVIDFIIGSGGAKGIGNPTPSLDGTDGVDGYLIIEYGG